VPLILRQLPDFDNDTFVTFPRENGPVLIKGSQVIVWVVLTRITDFNPLTPNRRRNDRIPAWFSRPAVAASWASRVAVVKASPADQQRRSSRFNSFTVYNPDPLSIQNTEHEGTGIEDVTL